MTSSLPYWQKRWATNPASFETSWPDEGCRKLELQYVKKVIQKLPADQPIIELGCGNFQLAEDPDLVELLKGRYLGIDGSQAAIDAALARNIPVAFQCADLTNLKGGPWESKGAFLLTKRTIQNIHPDARVLLWRRIAEFKAGLLIEDLVPFRNRTNDHRLALGRGPLDVPEFNWPISLNEEIWKLPGLNFYTFMGYYYLVTRCQPNVPGTIRGTAYELSRWAIAENRGQPAYGPVVAVHFGRPE